MGFLDSFKKSMGGGGSSSKDFIGGLASKGGIKSALGFNQYQNAHDVARGKVDFWRGGELAFKDATKAGLSVGFGAHLHSATTTRNAIQKLFDQDDTEKPPDVETQPGVGAETETEKSAARKRARQQAALRYGSASTINTSALGLQGQGAQVGKKKLVGE